MCVPFCFLLYLHALSYFISRLQGLTFQSIVAENHHHKLVLSLRSGSLHSRSPPKNQKTSSKILSAVPIALRKQIITLNGTTYKGKTISTIGARSVRLVLMWIDAQRRYTHIFLKNKFSNLLGFKFFFSNKLVIDSSSIFLIIFINSHINIFLKPICCHCKHLEGGWIGDG